MAGETVWLSLAQMSELFGRDKSVISRHVRTVYQEGELSPGGTVAFFATVQQEGDRNVSRGIEFYNLDVVISVGYRVKSQRGTQFRIWATRQLRDYLVKGFLLDDARFKAGGGSVYFDELLARIRDIRSSEKVFWRKVLDIYATSIDYDSKNDLSNPPAVRRYLVGLGLPYADTPLAVAGRTGRRWCPRHSPVQQTPQRTLRLGGRAFLQWGSGRHSVARRTP